MSMKMKVAQISKPGGDWELVECDSSLRIEEENGRAI